MRVGNYWTEIGLDEAASDENDGESDSKFIIAFITRKIISDNFICYNSNMQRLIDTGKKQRYTLN